MLATVRMLATLKQMKILVKKLIIDRNERQAGSRPFSCCPLSAFCWILRQINFVAVNYVAIPA